MDRMREKWRVMEREKNDEKKEEKKKKILFR